MRVIVAGLLAWLLAWPALADDELGTAYQDRPLLGAAAAKGAIIYNHGKGHLADPTTELPFYLDTLRDAGWDVFRLVRRWAEDKQQTSAERLQDAAAELRRQGYRKVVTVGQSFGAWISFIAGSRRGVFDAVVATAPAAYGTFRLDPLGYQNNGQIVTMAEFLAPVPVMVFLFANDDYDPGGRGDGLKSALASKGVPFAVIDRPEGFDGHAAGRTTAFARRFAHCIAAFLETATAGPFACAPQEPSPDQILRSFPAAAAAAPVATGASPFLGRWYGWYREGREVLLTVSAISPDGAVEATYAYGPLRHADKPASLRLRGAIDGETMKFRSDTMRQEYRLRSDRRLDLQWSKADGSGTISAVLRRLEEPGG